MNITPYGAAGEVTGSAYHLQSGKTQVLIDFGMFQGGKTRDLKNRVPRALNPRRLDAVLLTHAHLDHSGRLPLLAKRGFKGSIYATPATKDLAGLIMRDSAKVQGYDMERANRKRERAGQKPMEPMYGHAEVEAVMSLFKVVPYDREVKVAKGVTARFVEAGHMLGSSSIQLKVEENGRQHVLVFSGDIGPDEVPILKDPAPFQHADTVFLESTYGDRDHRPIDETIEEFKRIVREAVERQGKILVPTFAVGRAQLLLYLLGLMIREKSIPQFPIFLDSPMAIEATRIYLEHPGLFDQEMRQLRRVHPMLNDLQFLRPTVSADESRAINDVPGPCLVLAGAGMCQAGRILHHLKQNLWRPETCVIIVGYQVEGSLGRLLVDGRRDVKIFGEKIAVKASVHTLGGFSAHAGQTGLLKWLGSMADRRPRVFLTHGEDRARKPLAKKTESQFGITPQLPSFGEVIEI